MKIPDFHCVVFRICSLKLTKNVTHFESYASIKDSEKWRNFMELQVYNSQSQKKEKFETLDTQNSLENDDSAETNIK